MKNDKVKTFLLIPFFVLLWLPILQDRLHIFKGGELKGNIEYPADITFDFKNWFDGSYPEKKGEYLRTRFGLNPDFIRIHNQLKFWVFNRANDENYIFGKDNYLFEKSHVDGYYGTNFIGQEKIDSTVRELKELQDTLTNHGILMFVVFAPGKASFDHEYFPERIKRPMQPSTNYSAYVAACKSDGINFLDFRAWFQAMKDTSRFRLFPRGGFHWTIYGDCLALDSMAHYVESKTGKDLPDLKFDSIQVTTHYRRRDNDAGDLTNLIVELYSDTLAYPFCSSNRNGKDELSILNVGDSYFFEICDGPAPMVFNEVDFWFYYKSFWSLHGHTSNRENIKEEILKHQVVTILHSDATLFDFGSGFIHEALMQFRNKK